MQPTDQGVIATFKAYYLQRTMRQQITETEGEDKSTIREFWKADNIKKPIDSIGVSWDKMAMSTMKSVWRKVRPWCVNSFQWFEDVSAVQSHIVELAHEVGFD